MNDSSQAFDWSQARAFLATAEEGTFSAAARRLKLTQPTLGRQVAALEDDLGVLLFERVGKSLALTEAGRDLLEHVRAMGEAADRVALIAQGRSQAVDGQIRITASDVMSAHVLPPVLKLLRQRAPKLEIDVVAANDIRDLMRREADIAIRHVRPEQPELIARLVSEETGHFYAARSYLDARGRPRDMADMAAHDFISFGDTARMLEYMLPLGLPLSVENYRIGSANGVVAWELARQGLGIAVMSDRVAAGFDDMERLLLPEMEQITFPIWLTTHRELHTSRRIRLVFDMLAEFLSD
jgi:DNA-binding transcriptional LysR family regulator